MTATSKLLDMCNAAKEYETLGRTDEINDCIELASLHALKANGHPACKIMSVGSRGVCYMNDKNYLDEVSVDEMTELFRLGSQYSLDGVE